jgi:type 2A phosphatase activator TIP41
MASQSSPEIFEHRGVRFTVVADAPIATAEEFENLENALHIHAIPLPDMTYARNKLSISSAHAQPTDGDHARAAPPALPFTLEVTPLGALTNWCHRHLEPMTPTAYDWTYACEYDGNIVDSTGPYSIDGRSIGLPMDKLRRRDPILFQTSFSLFADELDDCGHVEASVKLRVMDGFFLLLVRWYLRVDRKRVALRDCRWYHEFGSRHVLRDIQVRQSDIDTVLRVRATLLLNRQ